MADPSGRAVRRKKEKTLGPATMPKHEAQQKLADYIEEYTGKLIHQRESIESFAELWKAFSAVKAGSWGKKMREDMKYLFDKHVLPVLGQYSPRKITLTPLQLLVKQGTAEVSFLKTVTFARWGTVDYCRAALRRRGILGPLTTSGSYLASRSCICFVHTALD